MSYERLKEYCTVIKDTKTGQLAMEKIEEIDSLINNINRTYSASEYDGIRLFGNTPVISAVLLLSNFSLVKVSSNSLVNFKASSLFVVKKSISSAYLV
jgi:hypothetical protein